ncbi:MAG: hypothetical protein FJY17_02045 [Bacteroidetes bacterium]|nr:hypothetical protein [Bacteroidota bacterium]
MPKSSKQIESEVLDYLNTLTPGKGEYELATLKGVDKYMLQVAKSFVDRVRDNITKNNLVSSGDLSTDLTFDFVAEGMKFELSVGYPNESSPAKYYDYVNKGVRGYVSGTPNSQYSFKNAFPNRRMAANIFSWVNKNRIKDKYEANVNKTKLGRKRAKLTQMVTEAENKRGLAYAIATGIKKKGLKRTLFFDNAVEFVFGQDFVNGLAKIYGKQVSLVIKSLYGNNNK